MELKLPTKYHYCKAENKLKDDIVVFPVTSQSDTDLVESKDYAREWTIVAPNFSYRIKHRGLCN